MKTSETVTKISAAFAKSWGEISNPKHNKKVTVKMKSGGSYQFEYTDLSGILDEVKPHFARNEIAISHPVFTEILEGKSVISVATKLIHSSGEWMESRPLQLPASGNIQDLGGQITYMKRYSLSAMLGVSTEEDDDANGSLGNEINYKDSKTSNSSKQVEKGVVKAKFITGGGTEEQFDVWYEKQMGSGYGHNQMDAYLTKKLAETK